MKMTLWTRVVAVMMATLITVSATADGGRAIAQMLMAHQSDSDGPIQPLPKFNRNPEPVPALPGGKRDSKRMAGRSQAHLDAHEAVKQDGTGFNRRVTPITLAMTDGDLLDILLQEGGGVGGPGGGGGNEGGGGGVPGGGEGELPNGGIGGFANSATGNFMLPVGIVDWPSRGMLGINFNIYHNSCSSRDREFGVGWSHSYDKRVVPIVLPGLDEANVYMGDGSIVPFEESPTTANTFISTQKGIFDVLTRSASGTVWTLTTVDQVQLEFTGPALMLTKIKDRYHPATLDIEIDRTTASPYYVTKVTCPSGRELNFTYGFNGKVDTVTDPMGRVWYFGYYTPPTATTVDNHLGGITFPVLGTSIFADVEFEYNAQDNIIRYQDRRNNDWHLTYTTGEWINTIDPPLYGSTNIYDYDYPSTNVTRLTMPMGQTIEHHYNADFLLEHTVDEAGFWQTLDYGSRGELSRHVDELGNTTLITANPNTGLIQSLQDPSGSVWNYSYNSRNDILTIQDPGETQVTTYDYNATTGLLEQIRNENSTVTAKYFYDTHGQVTSTEDALGRTTSLTRNTHGDVTSVTAPSGATRTVGYGTAAHGNLGRALSATRAGSTWTIEYDAWFRPVTLTHPGTPTAQVTNSYDLGSNLMSVTNERGHTASWVYDALNRVISHENFRGDNELYSYNLNSWKTSLTNGRGFTRNYDYTPRGELYHLLMPDGYEEYYTFDPTGNTVQFQNGPAPISYTYDLRGLMTEITYPTMQATQFNYDNQGRRTAMRDASGVTNWTYNLIDELTIFDAPQGRVEYDYNLAGEEIQKEEVGSPSVFTNYAIDLATGQLNSITKFGEVTSFGYDAHGRLQSRGYGNGTTEVLTYDPRQRLSSVSLIQNSITHRSQSYTYDPSSNIVSHTTAALGQPTKVRSYEYDNQHQLTSEKTVEGGLTTTLERTYQYDANGNRIQRFDVLANSTDAYFYDPGDKLQTITRNGSLWRDYNYDMMGRTTRITGAGGGYTFDYTEDDRVFSLDHPSGTDTFDYNGLGTRVGASWNGSPVESFLRDGGHVTASLLRDGGAGYNPGIGRFSAGRTLYAHSGLKNDQTQWEFDTASPPALDVTADREYDAFGRTVASAGAWEGPLGYAGGFGYQSSSANYDFQLLGHRYYDPETGRFLTRDPIKDGRNWYVYCGSNPIRFADPTGLIVWKVVLVAVILLAPTNGTQEYLEEVGDALDAITRKRLKFSPKKVARKLIDRFSSNDGNYPPIKPGSYAPDGFGKDFPNRIKEAAKYENRKYRGEYVCVYCRMETKTPHVDHAIPKSKGGGTELDNAQVTCPHCNLSKHNHSAPLNPPDGFEGEWPPEWWPDFVQRR